MCFKLNLNFHFPYCLQSFMFLCVSMMVDCFVVLGCSDCNVPS
nr:Putative uncharacterized protein [Moritella viscosa]